MIVADRADGVEAAQIVFVGRVVAVPGHHVERRMVERGRPQLAAGISRPVRSRRRDPRTRRPGSGSRAGCARPLEPIGPKLRQPQRRAVILADIAARAAVRQLDPEPQAARDAPRSRRGADLQHAEFGAPAAAAPACGTISSSPSASQKNAPASSGWRRTSGSHSPPAPPMSRRGQRDDSPSTKSVGSASGIGSGFQRSRFGDGGTSSKRLGQRAPARAGGTGRCAAAGRMRYSQVRRLAWRGTVNAVPDNCSAYRP